MDTDFIVVKGPFLAESTTYQILVGGPIVIGVVIAIVSFIVALDASGSATAAAERRQEKAEARMNLGLYMALGSLIFMLIDGIIRPTISAHI